MWARTICSAWARTSPSVIAVEPRITPHFGSRIKKDLHFSVGKHRGADIAAFHHNSACRSKSALLLNHPRAKMRMNGYSGGRAGDVRLANTPRNIHAIEQDAVAFQLWLKIDARRLGEFEQRLLLVKGEVALNRFQRECAIHCTRLQIEKPKAAGEMSSQRALPCTSRPIDGNNWPAASSTRRSVCWNSSCRGFEHVTHQADSP